jgi:hypothetical protein
VLGIQIFQSFKARFVNWAFDGKVCGSIRQIGLNLLYKNQIKAKALIVRSEGHFGNFWIWAKFPYPIELRS